MFAPTPPMLKYVSYYLLAGALFVIADFAFSDTSRKIMREYPALALVQVLRWPLSLFRKIRNRIHSAPSPFRFKPDDPSYYRRWMYKKLDELKSKEKFDEPILFARLMADVANVELSLLGGLGDKKNTRTFENDASRFEAGCYLFSVLDRWLHDRAFSKRQALIENLVKQFIEVSSKALGYSINNLEKTLNGRMSYYGELTHTVGRERETIERLTDFVAFVIAQGKLFDGREAPLSLDLERIEILIQMKLWSDSHVAASVRVLENYISVQ